MEYKKFVVLVCSFNNERWYEKNLISILDQDYPRYRVIYTEDCSTDRTAELVEEFIAKNDLESRIKLVRNKKNQNQVHNIYDMANACEDDEILLTVDGDDWLAHGNVLARLNAVYQAEDVWMTWGSYLDYPKMERGFGALPLSEEVIKQHAYRNSRWSLSHLRTFYCWLFKKINVADLMKDGEFFEMAGDLAFMFPMAEMCAGRFRYIDELLYIYNHENPLQEHKTNEKLQLAIDRYIRSKKQYKPL